VRRFRKPGSKSDEKRVQCWERSRYEIRTAGKLLPFSDTRGVVIGWATNGC
jgi:hypothetical protein